MSIDDATPDQWDAVRKDRYYDNRNPEDYVDGPFGPIHKSELGADSVVPYAPSPDVVEKPPHYRVGEVEAIDYIEQQLGGQGIRHYLEGNILKYMHRWRYKNGVEDLRKAKWYLDKLIFEEVQGG